MNIFTMAIFVVFILAVLFCVWFVLFVLKPRVHEIFEEERYVIYQQGLFKKIVGPGPVWIWEGIEDIKRKINVRSEPNDIVVNELFIYDVPFGYKLNYWSCLDLTMPRDAESTPVAELVQFDEHERHQQVLVKVRDALVKSIVKVQASQERTPGSLIEKILLIVPGLDGYRALMQYIQDELAQTLPTIGIRLDLRQPVTTTKLYLSPGIVQLLNRDRIFDQIENSMPGLLPTETVQALSAIEGLTVPSLLNLSSGDLAGGSYRAEYDVSEGEDGAKVRTRLKHDSSGQRQSDSKTATSPTAESMDDQPQQEVVDYKLTPADLAVLKKVA